MKSIHNYISIKTKPSLIRVDDNNIKKVVHEEINRLGVNADLNHIDISECTQLNSIFPNTGFCGDVSKWNTENIEHMQFTFYKCAKFNGDLSNWSTGKVISMQGMFCECAKFNQDITRWNVSNVESMFKMFYKAKKFNQPIGKWNIKSIKYMAYMFAYAEHFNQDLSKWDISGTYHSAGYDLAITQTHMFKNCPIDETNKPKMNELYAKQ